MLQIRVQKRSENEVSSEVMRDCSEKIARRAMF